MPGFEELCRQLGGSIHRHYAVECVIRASMNDMLDALRKAEEILRLAAEEARRTGRPYGVDVEVKGIGASEHLVVDALPDGGYELYVKLYSNSGLPGGEIQPNAVIRERVKVGRLTVKIEAYPEFNDDTGEWYGAAEVRTTVNSLEEAYRLAPKLLELAENYADRALDLVKVPRDLLPA